MPVFSLLRAYQPDDSNTNRNPNKQSNKQKNKTKQTIKSQKNGNVCEVATLLPRHHHLILPFLSPHSTPLLSPKKTLGSTYFSASNNTLTWLCKRRKSCSSFFLLEGGHPVLFRVCVYCVYLLEVLNACIFVLQQMNVVLQRGRGDMTTTARLKDEVTNFEMGATTQPTVIC